MKIEILEESGFNWAMRGLARSHNQPVEKMPEVALKLAGKDGGHNKFLESIIVWFDVSAPRFWWSEFDTYRGEADDRLIRITKQSDSTMHTLKKRPLVQEDFDCPILPEYLLYLNSLISSNSPIEKIKNALPDGFLQGRTICTNYKVMRNIILQRRYHTLPQWRVFCEFMQDNLMHSKYLGIERGVRDTW